MSYNGNGKTNTPMARLARRTRSMVSRAAMWNSTPLAHSTCLGLSAQISSCAPRCFHNAFRASCLRGGVEHNYRTILVSDAVAEVSRDTHESELKTMNRIFADVKTTNEVVAMLDGKTRD